MLSLPRTVGAAYSGSALEVGDVIYEVNRRVVSKVPQLRNTLHNMKSGDAVVLLFQRDGRLVYVSRELN